MSNTSNELEYFVRCASGFEAILAQELRALGMRRVRPLHGGVAFFGSLEDGYQACLWSRVATRVQLVLTRANATDADALYQAVASFPWEAHVRDGATIAVRAHGQNPNLRNTAFTALKVKDALCDRLRAKRGTRPNVDAKDPDFAVDVALHQQKATLYLNLSGASLHRRGYRQDGVQTEAPLKETLAAGILLAAGWPSLAKRGGCLVDPFCGSGTLAIEAALIAGDVAPGLLRTRWGFGGWTQHDASLFALLLAEAKMRRQEAQETRYPGLIFAGDLDPAAVGIARDNVRRAQVGGMVRTAVDDAARLGRHLRGLRAQGSSEGLLVSNPPYGKRLLALEGLAEANDALAQAVEALPAGWRVALITPNLDVDTALGRVPQQVIPCYNGPIQTWVRLYDTNQGARQTHAVVSLAGLQREVAIAEPGSAQFAGRLRKAARERMRWAKKEQVNAFRVYDADLPDYALSVDLYLEARDTDGDVGQRRAVVEEHRRPASVDEQRAARRLYDAAALAAAILDVPVSHVLVRAYGQAKRDQGPADKHRKVMACVEEGGRRFAIDLVARPDTGLPLDQRATRRMVRDLAADKRFACLYATAGATAVYAAAGGATSTVTVDPYADRVDWARSLMADNGFAGGAHRFVCKDVLAWLHKEARDRRRYDLVACALPAWMPGSHAELIRATAKVLSPRGTLVLMSSSREFSLDMGTLKAAGLNVEDVSARTLPHDFERSARQHHCFLVRT